MVWLSILPFAVALAYRVYLNRGQKSASPDEGHYMRFASNWRPGKTYQDLVEGFITRPKLEIPPTRYVFFALSAAVVALLRKKTIPYRTLTWIASVSGALAAPVAFFITRSVPAALLVAGSPLSLLLGRKALQDTTGALTILLGLWAIQAQSVWGLGISIFLALGSREALLLYCPALLVAWILRTGHWVMGTASVAAGGLAALGAFYILGGRRLGEVFGKLRKPTDYVIRVQAGWPHRVLIDLMFVSPVTTALALVATLRAPLWLVAFVVLALLAHSVATPKNVRFMLALDLGMRMLCAFFPNPWAWVIFGVGSVADLLLYRALNQTKDPVTYDLVLKTGMFVPPEVVVSIK